MENLRCCIEMISNWIYIINRDWWYNILSDVKIGIDCSTNQNACANTAQQKTQREGEKRLRKYVDDDNETFEE